MFSIDIKPSVPVMIQFCENYFIFFSPQICSDGLMVMERMNDKKKKSNMLYLSAPPPPPLHSDMNIQQILEKTKVFFCFHY